MRKTIASLLAACALALTGYSQVLNTNVNPPVLSGPLIDLFGTLSTATNWGIATFGIAAKNDTYGAGAVALYNITPFFATGVGIDWLDNQVTMPSGQIQFQAPLTIAGKIHLRPFAFTGIATPISGEGANNGTVVGLFGAGIGVQVYKGFHAFYAVEQRTGQTGVWQLFGLAYSLWF